MALPSKIIDELVNDPEFVLMSEQDQDSLIQELDQEVMGTIPKTENFLERAINAGNKAGQFIEGASDVAGFPGKQIGGYLGNKAVQSIFPGAFPVGTEESPARSVGQGVTSVLGLGALGNAGIRTAFPKFFAKRELPAATGRLTKSIQDVISKSKADPGQLGTSRDEILKVMKTEYAKSKVPSGPQGTLFRKWISKLEESNSLTNLTADTISEIEGAFGHVARFGKDASSNPILVQGAKQVNRFASGVLDNIAKKAGNPEFVKLSADKSKLLSTLSGKSSIPTKLARLALGGTAVAGAGSVAKSFLD